MSIYKKIITLLAILIVAGCSAQEPKQTSHSHDANHAHHHAPHDGITVPFYSKQGQAGFLEVKLHDDKGDIELWLTKDEDGTKPYDLPLASKINVTFPELNQKQVALQVRNSQKNEDEDGNGTIRNNRTNYFIFPSKKGEDASFLVGKDFVSPTVISFTAGGVPYKTFPFELFPHSH